MPSYFASGVHRHRGAFEDVAAAPKKSVGISGGYRGCAIRRSLCHRLRWAKSSVPLGTRSSHEIIGSGACGVHASPCHAHGCSCVAVVRSRGPGLLTSGPRPPTIKSLESRKMQEC